MRLETYATVPVDLSATSHDCLELGYQVVRPGHLSFQATLSQVDEVSAGDQTQELKRLWPSRAAYNGMCLLLVGDDNTAELPKSRYKVTTSPQKRVLHP